jgi:hypothetical protein
MIAITIPPECLPRFFVAPDASEMLRAQKALTFSDCERIRSAAIKRARKASIRLAAEHIRQLDRAAKRTADSGSEGQR